MSTEPNPPPSEPKFHIDADSRRAARRRSASRVLLAFVILSAALLGLALAGCERTALVCWGLMSSFLFLMTLRAWRVLLRENEKKARRLKDRDFRYRQTLALLPEGVVIMKDDGRIDWMNSMAEEHLGLPTESAGALFSRVMPDEALCAWIAARDFSEPFAWSSPEGDRTLEITGIAPDSRHTTIMTRDITEEKKLNDVRRDFVANVSHELRTPLTVLSGFLDMEPPATLGSVELYHRTLMREQTKRMKRLLDDLLTLSRLEKGETDESDVIAMKKLVEDVVREGEALSMGRHRFTSEIEDICLIGLADDIRSAAMNLVSNAVRYTPEGGSIAVRWKAEGGGAVFSVTDTGIGIDPKHIPRLTERFYRVDKGRSRSTGGTGLGLAIVKHILRRSGATLTIQSALGKGSTFAMHFPAARTFRDAL